MDFDLTIEQRLLVKTIRDFVDSELVPVEDDVERSGVLAPDLARQLFNKSRALGLYALNMPEELGGGGLNTLDWMLAEEQFGRTTDILIRRAFGNVYEILLQGTGVQCERWLLPSIRGDRTFSIAFTEPGAGSDAAGIQTRARRDGDDWVLTGTKHFISDALYSDFFVVTARTDDNDESAELSTFIVDRGLRGFNLGPDQKMMGLRGTTHAELNFDNVRLDADCLLGEPGEGLKLAFRTLGRVRLAQVGARSVGKAQRVFELTREYARNRKQFGKAIGSFQSIQQMLADSVAEIQSARLLLYHCAWLIDQGLEAREEISLVKVVASETLDRVVDRAMQIYAGAGYGVDLPIERYYRDARVYRIFDGTSEIHRGVVGRGLMRSSRSLFKVEV